MCIPEFFIELLSQYSFEVVRRIAPEFYEELPSHSSWVKVIYDFIFDPKLGPFTRMKRHYTNANANVGHKMN